MDYRFSINVASRRGRRKTDLLARANGRIRIRGWGGHDPGQAQRSSADAELDGRRRLDTPIDGALADPEAASKVFVMAGLYGRVLEMQLQMNESTLGLRDTLLEAVESR
ncbi:hypothetical protein E5163_15385 [Marinicauda algicola]|uniref:Uncharacterized protein n=1 Tax=Marinicauda algicola TaxID=2029849 RepID=A0A4S2GWH8_9PROT|nr:hypothetical protein [Marinicauda algicola]TGY87447.1 hypothetical protein E5163_15385 [Marinicauda algicola]